MSKGFQEDSILIKTSDGRHIILMESFTYITNAGSIINIPAFIKSDGASVPKIFWNIIPPFGNYWKAAVLHDYLYRYTLYPKKYCDAIFYEAMSSLGVDIEIRKIMFKGVSIGGWKSFKEARELNLKVPYEFNN